MTMQADTNSRGILKRHSRTGAITTANGLKEALSHNEKLFNLIQSKGFSYIECLRIEEAKRKELKSVMEAKRLMGNFLHSRNELIKYVDSLGTKLLAATASITSKATKDWDAKITVVSTDLKALENFTNSIDSCHLVKSLLKERGYSLEDFALRLNQTVEDLTNFLEHGHCKPKLFKQVFMYFDLEPELYYQRTTGETFPFQIIEV